MTGLIILGVCIVVLCIGFYLGSVKISKLTNEDNNVVGVCAYSDVVLQQNKKTTSKKKVSKKPRQK